MIYIGGRSSKSTLESYLYSEKNSLEAFNRDIESYESGKYAVANGD